MTEYSNKDTLTLGSYKLSPAGSQGSRVNVQVTDKLGNRLHSRLNAPAEGNFAFTAPEHSDFDVCFQNMADDNVAPNPASVRSVELTVRTSFCF